MTPKEYLNQLHRLNEMINSDIAEVQKLRTLCESLPGQDFSKERVSGGVQGNKMADMIGKIVDLEREIKSEIDSYIDLEREIRGVINAQDDMNERLLLRLRYIEFNTWEQIAEKMDYSTVHVWRIHGTALNNLKNTRYCGA